MRWLRNEVASTRRAALARAVWLALVVAVLIGGPALAGPELGKLSGKVEIGHGSPPAWRQAEPGAAIAPGDLIRTGSDGRAEVRLAAGSVRIYENSLLRLPATDPGPHEVELERGSSIFDILRRKTRDRFEVKTPDVVVSVKGTLFTVDLTGELASIAVFRGIVGVRGPDMDVALETLVREGFAATGGGGHPFELDVAPESDPWQGWENAERLPDISGRRLERMQQARDAALSSTSAEVVERAAKRNPEVARRLEQIRARRRGGAGKEEHEADELTVAPPAAPQADRGRDRRDAWREALEEGGHDPHSLTRNRLRRREETGIDVEEMIDRDGPSIEPGAFQDIVGNLTGTPGDDDDYAELWQAYQEFVSSYASYADELAQGGIDAYRDLLMQSFINRGIDPTEAQNLANMIIEATWPGN